jgi:hypothetical protein
VPAIFVRPQGDAKRGGPAWSWLAIALFVFGLLLSFEFIRPFRDLNVDLPIALGGWALGGIVALIAIWKRAGSLWINIAAATCNFLAFAGLCLLVYASGITRLM